MSNDHVDREEARLTRHPRILIAGIVTAWVIAPAGAVGTIAARTADTTLPAADRRDSDCSSYTDEKSTG